MKLSEETTKALYEAAQLVWDNIVDCGDWGPGQNHMTFEVDRNEDEIADYPVDEDGDAWYPDVWALRQALIQAQSELDAQNGQS